ncbi:MAG TPA: cobalt ECF transporter T component CbiQ [Elusimicrobia bacterium]|nr:cobalt ECF transporter T component CbiQ [Elusimicrobiota bacterium]
MNKLGENLVDIGYMDTLAAGDSPLHRLDPRAKIFTTFLFLVAVVSFNKYEVSALVPFFLYPVFLIFAGELPAGYLAGKILVVAPFAILVGIFNPVLDRQILFHIGSLGISGGWISFLSILMRFVLTVSAALALLSITGINSICEALARSGVPRPFVVQLLFLNRYIFSLTGESERMSRARSLRSCSHKAMNFGIFTQIAGHLLLRTFDRAERVYQAMLCRGFDGHIRVVRYSRIGRREIAFMLVWAVLFVVFRFVNISLILGQTVTGLLK